jgi:allene oxide cyclase-like protein
MAGRRGCRMLPAMRKLILPAIIAAAVIALTSLSPASAHQKDHVLKLTTKTVDFAQVDVGQPGASLGDSTILTEDVYRDGKKVGTSDISCTVVRLDKVADSFASECLNTTVLAGGQISTQGYVTSAQEEQIPFQQAITGGTGAYEGVSGQLTIDDRGDGPAHLTFDLVR